MKKSYAFGDPKTEYYELLQNIPCVDAGAIFYYDPNDHKRGSLGQGCLKLCWTPAGNCYGNDFIKVCAKTIVFHAEARNDERWFQKIK